MSKDAIHPNAPCRWSTEKVTAMTTEPQPQPLSAIDLDEILYDIDRGITATPYISGDVDEAMIAMPKLRAYIDALTERAERAESLSASRRDTLCKRSERLHAANVKCKEWRVRAERAERERDVLSEALRIIESGENCEQCIFVPENCGMTVCEPIAYAMADVEKEAGNG